MGLTIFGEELFELGEVDFLLGTSGSHFLLGSFRVVVFKQRYGLFNGCESLPIDLCVV
jgi:hypothetical protein